MALSKFKRLKLSEICEIDFSNNNNNDGRGVERQNLLFQAMQPSSDCGRDSCYFCGKAFTRRSTRSSKKTVLDEGISRPMCKCPERRTYCSMNCYSSEVMSHHATNCKNVDEALKSISFHQKNSQFIDRLICQVRVHQTSRETRIGERLTTPLEPYAIFPKPVFVQVPATGMTLGYFKPEPVCVGCMQQIKPTPISNSRLFQGERQGRAEGKVPMDVFVYSKGSCKGCGWPVCDIGCARGKVHMEECCLLRELNGKSKGRLDINHPIMIDFTHAYFLLAVVRIHLLLEQNPNRFIEFVNLPFEESQLTQMQLNIRNTVSHNFPQHVERIVKVMDLEAHGKEYADVFNRILLYLLDLGEVCKNGSGYGIYPTHFVFSCEPNSLLELKDYKLTQYGILRMVKGVKLTVTPWMNKINPPSFATPLLKRATLRNGDLLFGARFCQCLICNPENTEDSLKKRLYTRKCGSCPVWCILSFRYKRRDINGSPTQMETLLPCLNPACYCNSHRELREENVTRREMILLDGIRKAEENSKNWDDKSGKFAKLVELNGLDEKSAGSYTKGRKIQGWIEWVILWGELKFFSESWEIDDFDFSREYESIVADRLDQIKKAIKIFGKLNGGGIHKLIVRVIEWMIKLELKPVSLLKLKKAKEELDTIFKVIRRMDTNILLGIQQKYPALIQKKIANYDLQ